jgi:hypothetical protein
MRKQSQVRPYNTGNDSEDPMRDVKALMIEYHEESKEEERAAREWTMVSG